MYERVWAHYSHFHCKVSLRPGEFEVLAWLISPFISRLGMLEPAGQGLNSACFGGNSRLVQVWSHVHVCASVACSPLSQKGPSGLFHTHLLENEQSACFDAKAQTEGCPVMVCALSLSHMPFFQLRVSPFMCQEQAVFLARSIPAEQRASWNPVQSGQSGDGDDNPPLCS